MKIHKAINKIIDNQDLWARPKSWRGSGEALRVSGTYVYVVPSMCGGTSWTPSVFDLIEQWEVVEPDDVLSETTNRARS